MPGIGMNSGMEFNPMAKKASKESPSINDPVKVAGKDTAYGATAFPSSVAGYCGGRAL